MVAIRRLASLQCGADERWPATCATAPARGLAKPAPVMRKTKLTRGKIHVLRQRRVQHHGPKRPRWRRDGVDVRIR